MIEKIITSLLEIPDETYATYLLKNDILFHKIHEKEYRSLVQQAKRCGIDVAKQIKSKHNYIRIDEYLTTYNIHVKLLEEEIVDDFIHFGSYKPPNTIMVYSGNMQKAISLIDKRRFPILCNHSIIDVIKAHELFHYLEDKDDHLFVNNYKVSLWRIWKYTHMSKICALAEIASMSFAKELLNLEYNPTALNVILLYPYNKESAIQIYNDIIANTVTKIR